MTHSPSVQRPTTRTRVATVFAILGLLGSTALLGFDVYLALHSAGFAGLAIAVTHLLYGWIATVLALVGLILRRTPLTVGALIVAVAVLILPPVLVRLF